MDGFNLNQTWNILSRLKSLLEKVGSRVVPHHFFKTVRSIWELETDIGGEWRGYFQWVQGCERYCATLELRDVTHRSIRLPNPGSVLRFAGKHRMRGEMGFCTSCGSTTNDEARFCEKCGVVVVSKSIVETTQAKTIEVVAPSAATWHVTFATGQTGGPFTEDEIRSMIARQQIKITDSVIATGGATWVPITQSPFARYIVTQATVDRLAASTCPQCGAAMAVVLQRSKAGLVLVIIGLITTPLFGIGIPIFIVGFILRWGFKPKAKYQCPRCNYRT